jgi:hypothetical protein
VAGRAGLQLRERPGEGDLGVYFVASHLGRYVALPGLIRRRRSVHVRIALNVHRHVLDTLPQQDGNDRVAGLVIANYFVYGFRFH